MPAPTNPRKKALMPASPLRKKLRAAGHHLGAIVQIGKEGVTDPVVRQLDDALAHHELVKVKVGTESPEDRFEAAERLGAATDAQLAQILGRTALVYRKHPEHPKYEPGPVRLPEDDDAEPAPRARARGPRSRGASARFEAKPRGGRASARAEEKPRGRASSARFGAKPRGGASGSRSAAKPRPRPGRPGPRR